MGEPGAATRVGIVEDHGLMAQTVAAALRQEPDLEVEAIHVAATTDVLAILASAPPDLVLLDLDLGERGSAVALIGPLRAQGAEVVVVTGVTDRVRHAECVEAGASGVISKSEPFEVLLDTVRRAARAEPLLTKHERDELLAALRQHRRQQEARWAGFAALTPREQHVLAELMDGRAVRDIAGEAFVSVATVRTQVRAILGKLGVGSQVAAISKAQRAGWRPGITDR